MGFEAFAVLEALRQLGDHGGVFQYRHLRESVGVDPSNRNAHSNLWVYFNSLAKNGILEEVPSGRKRNRDYRLKNTERLNEMLNSQSRMPTDGNGQAHITHGGAADKISRIENKIDKMLIRIDAVEAKLDKLIGAWF